MLAGPSEILIIADETANPIYTAADMLSQAEHDPLACSIVITTDLELAKKVAEEVKSQLENYICFGNLPTDFIDKVKEVIDLIGTKSNDTSTQGEC